MASMKAARIHEFGGPKVIQIGHIPIPQPGRGEVLIRTAASGKLQITLDMTFEPDEAAQEQRDLEEVHVQDKMVLGIVG